MRVIPVNTQPIPLRVDLCRPKVYRWIDRVAIKPRVNYRDRVRCQPAAGISALTSR